MTVRPVSWSSAAVGSSQTSRRGSWTRARAIATRCMLAAGELAGQALSLLAHPERRPGPRRPCSTARSLRPAGDHQRDRRVLGGRERGQEVVLLEDEADVPGPEPRPVPVAHRRDLVAEDRHRRPRRVENAGDHRQQGRLAAARRADDQRHLARRRRPSRRRAAPCTRCSPVPKCLVRPRIRTATGRGDSSSRSRSSIVIVPSVDGIVSHPIDSLQERDRRPTTLAAAHSRKTIAGSSRSPAGR